MSQSIASIRASKSATIISTAATASAITLAAQAAVAHHVTAIEVTVSAAVTNMAVTLTDNAVVIREWRMTGTGALIVQFASPLRLAPGMAGVLNVASGGGAVVTVANLASYTQ